MNTSTTFPRFIAAGEALTDLIRGDGDAWHAKVGGATWNVARVMAKLGIPSAFAGAVSRDCFGDELVEASRAAGLDLRFLQQNAHSPLLAVVHQTNPPAYFFVGDDSADLHFDPAQLPAGWLSRDIWLHFGGISLARPRLANTLLQLARDARAIGAKISFDPNFRVLMNEDYDPVLREMAQLADVIKVSDEDLRGLFRTDDEAAAFATLRSWNPQALYLYTRGAAGASLYHGDAHWQQTPPQMKVVDTVGAGDASMGGLIWSLMQHPQADGATHLRHAVAAGSLACTRAGANPPEAAELCELYKVLSATLLQTG
ncbi:carbohydrate kinase family protein [Chitinilyticum litopenaei]|uniref:carbohydrate kinase family protein n=1 Tax=Chitinilyticum litopenaei TaxID=1121276 RepID=UPI00041039F8|nr:carbohydrate kinase [Chitinilyticum litopenaei]